jgi:L-threonate 2-dehydrogenase
MTSRIGMIGLGIMGGAMARNMVQAGIEVVGFDIDAAACAAAREAGIRVAPSPEAVAVDVHDILVCLPHAKAVRATAQALATAAMPLTVVECSTLALEDKIAFRAALETAPLKSVRHTALDCPLSGTGAQAKTKDVVVFASGPEAAIERLGPVFAGFARKVFALGDFGNGSKMKFVANHLVAIHNVAAAEAMVLGMKAGLDPHRIVEVVGSGAGTSRMFEMRAPLMARNEYLPATMRMEMWKKDMQVIGAFAADLDCPTPLFTLTNAIYDAARAQGHHDEDTAAVCAVLEQMAGLKR